MPTRAPQPPGKFSLLALLEGAPYETGLSKISADRYGSPQFRGQALPHSGLLRDLGVVLIGAQLPREELERGWARLLRESTAPPPTAAAQRQRRRAASPRSP